MLLKNPHLTSLTRGGVFGSYGPRRFRLHRLLLRYLLRVSQYEEAVSSDGLDASYIVCSEILAHGEDA